MSGAEEQTERSAREPGSCQARAPGGVSDARLAAVIVHFRTPECLDACVAALARQTQPPAEIVVLDNSAVLDGATEPPSARPDYRWVPASGNIGYGAACNLGARLTRSDSVLFLNADLTLAPDACERLLAAAVATPQAAIFGPRIRARDGGIELSARAFPTLTTGVLGRSSLATRWLAARGRTPPAVAGALGSSDLVDWVSGACMLIRRAAFERVGGFDEGYWMYWEDADLCRRLRASGWRTMLCAEAEARHLTGSSGRSERTIEAFHRSAGRYFTLHLASSAAAGWLARLVLGARMRLVLRRHRAQGGG